MESFTVPAILMTSHIVLHTVPFLGPFGVVEPVQCSDQVSGYPPYALEAKFSIFLFAVAFRTFFSNYSVVSAHGVAVYRVVYGTVPDSGLFHGPDDLLKCLKVTGRISVELAHSKITNDLLPSQIEGERGTIQIDHLSTPRNVRIDYRGDVVRGSATEAPREQGDNGRVLDLPKSSNTMEYELTDFITAICGIDNVKEEIWETPAGRHELGHYRDVTLVSLRIMDAVRQQAGITFPADAGKQA